MSQSRGYLPAVIVVVLVLVLAGGWIFRFARAHRPSAEACRLASILASYPSYQELGCTSGDGRSRCVVDAPRELLPDIVSCEDFELVPLHASEQGDPCAGPSFGLTDSGEWVVLLHTFGVRHRDGRVESLGMLMRATGGGRAEIVSNDRDAERASDEYLRYVLLRSRGLCESQGSAPKTEPESPRK